MSPGILFPTAIRWPHWLTHAQQYVSDPCASDLQHREGPSTNTRSQCIRIFDINLRQQYFNADTIRQSLELATVLKLNDEELSVLAELLDLKGDETSLLLKILETFHLKLIALTRGAAGSRLITTSEHSDHPGYRVKIKDTVGAGDSFTAALAVGLLRDGELEKIHDYANRLASYVCGYRGAMPELTSELMQEAV